MSTRKACLSSVSGFSGITRFLLFVLLSKNSIAGTYNFYFNNTEQGDHSVASPSLTTTDNEAAQNTSDKKNSAATSTTPSINRTETQSKPDTSDRFQTKLSDRQLWRLQFGTFALKKTINEKDNDYYYVENSTTFGPFISAGFYPIKWVGCTFSLGFYTLNRRWGSASLEPYLAFDGEVRPIVLDLFGIRDALSLGVFAGINNTHWSSFSSEDRFYNFEVGRYSPYVGIRLGAKISEHWGFATSARRMFGQINILQFDGGVTYSI